MTDLRSMARALGGEISGRSVLCPGPGHSARDRSLSVMISASAPDGFLVWSHAGDDPLAAKDYVRQRLALPLKFEPKAHREVFSKIGENLSDRTARALAIWNEAHTPIGSPVERYLARRGLGLPDDPHEVIRFHPSCPFAGSRTGAMIALVRDVVTNTPVAIHRTALNLDGNKIEVNGRDRMALGPIGGGAVKLSADETVTLALGIGEGIETTLSLKGLPEFGDTPHWALLNAGGLAGFPVLPGIESLWIAADHDPAGLKAAHACAARWRASGAETFIVQPNHAGRDLNDVIQEARHG